MPFPLVSPFLVAHHSPGRLPETFRRHGCGNLWALMWERWQRGETMHAIGKLFDRRHTSIQKVFGSTGGIRPQLRCRSRFALTLEEREEISRGLVTKRSIRSIASGLGHAPSTISREIRRNGGRRHYRASRADQAAWDRAKRPKVCKLAQHRELARLVTRKLELQWSPRQIAGWLRSV